jgi:hypothetical protein
MSGGDPSGQWQLKSQGMVGKFSISTLRSSGKYHQLNFSELCKGFVQIEIAIEIGIEHTGTLFFL